MGQRKRMLLSLIKSKLNLMQSTIPSRAPEFVAFEHKIWSNKLGQVVGMEGLH